MRSGFLNVRGEWIELACLTHHDMLHTPEFCKFVPCQYVPEAPLQWDTVNAMGVLRVGYIGKSMILDGGFINAEQLAAFQRIVEKTGCTNVIVELWDTDFYKEYYIQDFMRLQRPSQL